jgi:hypothetical protein
MVQGERTTLYVDATRLHNFLQNNQLVQAHAISQKLESALQHIIERDCSQAKSRAEDHPLWKPFRGVVRAKSRILAGVTTDARLETENVMELL